MKRQPCVLEKNKKHINLSSTDSARRVAKLNVDFTGDLSFQTALFLSSKTVNEFLKELFSS